MTDTFKALLVESPGLNPSISIRPLTFGDLPEGEVLVRVRHSSLNYKDALALTGQAAILKSFPMVPGIDLAGTVVESSDPAFSPGDEVLATGWGIGERRFGGYSQMVRLKGDWLLPLPAGLDSRAAMALGTAGLTAMLCIGALEAHGATPDSGEILVTGATGGVGSLAVALLARRGYHVAAVTGRTELGDCLRELGASEILSREDLASDKPLAATRWAGAIDVAGGNLLAQLLKSMAYGGTVAACGLAAGAELNTTVYPFILRGVTLAGIDSVMCPKARRQAAWDQLADFPIESLELPTVPLEALPGMAQKLLANELHGRVLVDLDAEAA